MKLVDLKCPNCNHAVSVKEGQDVVHCEYCDAQLFADFGERRLRIINEAELRKVALMQKEFSRIKDNDRIFSETRTKRLKQRRMWLLTTIAIHFLFVILIIAFTYTNLHSGSRSMQNKILCALLALNLVCPIVLSITRPFVPKQSWDKNESSTAKLFILLLITGLAADFTGLLMSAAVLG